MEKKLTDEEIVRALECMANSLSGTSGYTVDIIPYAIDLIHRLQDENNQLKSPKFASWKLKFFRLKEEFDKELAEHEEFTKKAKAEIERLKIDIKNEKNWGKIQTKQAVKDAAKEILDEVSKHFGGKWLVELYKKYGLEWSVEVE